jgi:hypothetical protein
MANTSLTSVGHCADSWSREPRPWLDTRPGPPYTRVTASCAETSPAGLTPDSGPTIAVVEEDAPWTSCSTVSKPWNTRSTH